MSSVAQFLSRVARRRQTPAPSLRALAKASALSPGFLSQVMSGERRLSLKSALKLAQGLALDERETKELCDLVQHDAAVAAGVNTPGKERPNPRARATRRVSPARAWTRPPSKS